VTAILYLIIGLAVGAASCMLPGPCGLAVVGAAYRCRLRRAVGIAVGAGLGDAAYAALGVAGLGPLLNRNPALLPLSQAVSGVALGTYGLLTVRGRAAPAASAALPEPSRGHLRRGLGVGLALVATNPASAFTWVLVAGSLLAGVTPAAAWAATAGIGLGSVGGYLAIAVLTRRGRDTFGAGIHRLTRIAGGLVAATGLLMLAGALRHLLRR